MGELFLVLCQMLLLITKLYWKVGARLPDDRLRWSFKLYDEDNSGSIALDEMEKVGCNLLEFIIR